MNKNKVFLIVLGVLIIFGVAGYFLLKKSTGEPSVPNKDELVSYVPASKEYSFNYPKNWFINDVSNYPNNSYIAITNYDVSLLPPHGGPSDFFKIEVYRLANENHLSLKDWIENLAKESPTGSSIIDEKESVIDGEKALLVTQTVGGEPRQIIYIQKEDFIYLIQGGSRDQQFQNFFDTFLQSFHFIRSR